MSPVEARPEIVKKTQQTVNVLVFRSGLLTESNTEARIEKAAGPKIIGRMKAPIN